MDYQIIDVNESNLDKYGLFCNQSQKRKLDIKIKSYGLRIDSRKGSSINFFKYKKVKDHLIGDLLNIFRVNIIGGE
ncbi:MAG: hypothetical protein ACFFDT_06370 [Candidatus Hodarchaeota archaeon]